MSTKTITLAGSEVKAEFSGANAWLRNDGADVIYAAAKPGITAGADGVVAIPAGQSAPVYGANGTVWLLGTGSVQLIGSDYSTNPFKTSAQAGGSGADNVARAAISAHSGNADIHVTATEKAAWSGKAELSDIPTTLPANGGNADTIDGKHYSDFVNYLGEITDVNNILNNPEYGDCSYEGIISSNVATSIGLSSAVATEWSIKCFRATEGSGFQIAVPIYNSSETPKYRIAAKHPLNGSAYSIGWDNWQNFSDGGNADTVDGKNASDFMQNLGILTTGSLLDYVLTLTESGSFFISDNVTDTPISGLFYGVDVIRHSGGDYVITATRFNGGGVWTNRYNAGMAKWYGWSNVADGGNAATVGGKTITVTDVDPGAGTALNTGEIVFVTEVT